MHSEAVDYAVTELELSNRTRHLPRMHAMQRREASTMYEHGNLQQSVQPWENKEDVFRLSLPHALLFPLTNF